MSNSEFEPLLATTASDAERRLLRSAKADASNPGAREAMLAALGVPVQAPSERWLEWLKRHRGVSAVHGVALALLVGAGASVAFSVLGSSTPPAVAGSHTADVSGSPEAPSVRPEAPVVRDEVLAPAETAATRLAPPIDSTTASVGVRPQSLPVARPATSPRGRTSASAVPTPSSGDALEREIERIEAARTALRRDRAEETLRVLDAYDRDFPRGAFAIEVSVLRIEALVRAKRLSEARGLGERFLAEHREGAFARRVESTLAAAHGATSATEDAPPHSAAE